MHQNYEARMNYIHSEVGKIMENFEQSYQHSTETSVFKSQVFLNQIYQIRDSVNYEELREELKIFLTAGFETSGKGISGILLMLAMNQKEQDKVVAEINDVLTSDDEEVNEIMISKLKYLSAVIQESLRLIPVTPLIAREVSKDVQLSKAL